MRLRAIEEHVLLLLKWCKDLFFNGSGKFHIFQVRCRVHKAFQAVRDCRIKSERYVSFVTLLLEPTPGSTEIGKLVGLVVGAKVIRSTQTFNGLPATDFKEHCPESQNFRRIIPRKPIVSNKLYMIGLVLTCQIGVLDINHYCRSIVCSEEDDIRFVPRLLKPWGMTELKERGGQGDGQVVDLFFTQRT